MKKYRGSFKSWTDVAVEFGGVFDDPVANLAKIPRPDEVLLAVYDNEGWDGDALVVYRNGDTYYWVEGSHCSCYGLEDQWNPEDYDLATFVEVLKRKTVHSEYYGCEEGTQALPALRNLLIARLEG